MIKYPGWMGGLASGVHHTTPPLRPLHPQVIRKAYPPWGASRDTGRNGRWCSGFGVAASEQPATTPMKKYFSKKHFL